MVVSDDKDELVAALRAQALALGFADLRVTSATSIPGIAEDLREFINQGCHGDMGWLADNFDRRTEPQNLWSDAKSIIMVAVNYGQTASPLSGLPEKDRGYISLYARGIDYHKIMKKRLRKLGEWLVREHGGLAKMFVDTAPVMEKPLAARAGIGWQGHHTNLVSRQFGSWLFLGCLFTTLSLPSDQYARNLCGNCRDCEKNCPTGALADGRIDPGRCIAYLTVEHKGDIPPSLAEKMGNRIFGCDDCLAICPWNKFASEGEEIFRSGKEAPRLADLIKMNDQEFRAFFAGSPIKRLGISRFKRNVLIAIGNSGNAVLLPSIYSFLGEDIDSVVRHAAVWALGRF